MWLAYGLSDCFPVNLIATHSITYQMEAHSYVPVKLQKSFHELHSTDLKECIQHTVQEIFREQFQRVCNMFTMYSELKEMTSNTC